MSMFAFWVVTPCGLVGRYQYFGETYCLHFCCSLSFFVSLSFFISPLPCCLFHSSFLFINFLAFSFFVSFLFCLYLVSIFFPSILLLYLSFLPVFLFVWTTNRTPFQFPTKLTLPRVRPRSDTLTHVLYTGDRFSSHALMTYGCVGEDNQFHPFLTSAQDEQVKYYFKVLFKRH
jgi:hypothetical protein